MWAGEIEKEGGARNPYLYLEERYGFWDIRVSFCVCLFEIGMFIYLLGLGRLTGRLFSRLNERNLRTGFVDRRSWRRSEWSTWLK